MKSLSFKRFKSTICITLILIWVLICTSCTYKQNKPEEYFFSVFELVCSEEGRFDSIGTGFKCNGFIYTNAHIVTYTELKERVPYSSITALFYNSSDKIKLKIDKIDYEKDIVKLRLIESSDKFDKIKSLLLADSDQIFVGQDIITIGNINGYGLALNKGCISAKPRLIERNGIENCFLQTSIEISKGSSGGPVIDNLGNVIGMMTFKLRDANGEYIDGMSFAIPSNTLSNFN